MTDNSFKITWLGHSGFKIEYKDTGFLIDPWFTGNPMFAIDERNSGVEGCDFILLSHAHSDHSADSIEIAKEKGLSGTVRFDYAGMYFEASLNIDRTRTKNPTKSEVIEQFRKMLPEGEQTVENARKVYDSLTSQASQTDSVTSKEVNPPQEVLDAKREEFEKELNAGQ